MNKKGVQQRKGSKRSSNSGIDLWKKIGYVPNKISKKEMHKKSYKERMNLPEGKGTSRSKGSNKRLEWLLYRR